MTREYIRVTGTGLNRIERFVIEYSGTGAFPWTPDRNWHRCQPDYEDSVLRVYGRNPPPWGTGPAEPVCPAGSGAHERGWR